MSIAISPEHAELGAAVRGFLERRCPPEVARAALDSEDGAEQLPSFWSELGELGWLGLHLPEEHGGGGYGLVELAVVVEELARAGAPGPFLPTVLAGAAVSLGGGRSLLQEVLPPLAEGRAVAALAFPASPSLSWFASGSEGAIVLSGSVRPLPGAALADWVVVPASAPGGERWCVVPSADLVIEELPSLDPTRRTATVRADAVLVDADHQLAGLDRAGLEAVVAAVVAAECAGGAAWCVETAAAYAKIREQFGRPVGQFQGVKHRCADMLVATETARALAWDAVTAIDQSPQDAGISAEARLAANMAGALAPDAYCRVAKDCIQVLGGIGFTWEHDAHRYLRRATSLRQLMGGSTAWRRTVSDLALSGVRRHLRIDLPAEAEHLRSQARSAAQSIAALPREERRARLVESGYFVPHWPPPWGLSAGPVEQLVIDEELAEAGVRRPSLNIGAWAAPTIALHGTPAQQQRWVGPTLLGCISWCQLFSEPGAGSDLAALTTRATPTEGGWVLNGQKVWTSMATEANWGMCLARTGPSVPKHAGITYFVLDMRSPGIDVRPLREMTGLSLFNEVFLDDVFVPDDCVIGPVNAGWGLARTTLANERVAMGSGASFGGGLEALLNLARALGPGSLGPIALDGIGALVAEAHGVSVLGHRAASRAVSGADPGPEASVRKLLSAEHDQRAQEFGLGLLGADGAAVDGLGAQWTFGFLANRCLTIAGGTSEVQRNVIAERLLGLPRDPEPEA
ncbi:MAG: acyl-CoA dehydrogenase [Acidimicrobiales bacterium]